jgi:peptide/nickel transport system permease protein
MDRATRDEADQTIDGAATDDMNQLPEAVGQPLEPDALTPSSADAITAEVEAVGGNVVPLLGGRWAPRASSRRRRRMRGRPMRILAVAFLALMVGWALVPQLFASGSPTAVNPVAALLGPSGHFPLGTDQYGRSIYTELVYGARPALEVGIACTVLGGVVGSVIGIIGGYLGGWVDMLVMRLIDILLALPGLLLALIFIAALPRTLTNEILAISISTVPIFARVVRGQALQVRSRPFIDAATVTGVRRRVVIWRHVLPNCMTPAIVLAAVYVGVVIVVAASLNFLGLGPSEGVLDWGALISSGQGYIDKDWWISVFPGLTVALLVISVSIMGDWLRDVLEPASG